MTPHREWLCEYEEYDGGEVLLGDEIPCKINGHARNLIFVSKIVDADVDFNLIKIGYKMIVDQ